MEYTKVLLVQRRDELEQQLMIADTMQQRVVVDAELTRVEDAIADLEEVN